MKSTKSNIPIVDMKVPGAIEHLEHVLTERHNIHDRERPYDGQCWTSGGERGSTQVTGLTMRDVSDCLMLALLDSSPSRPGPDSASPCIQMDDIYALNLEEIDPGAIAQNLCCWIEKYMGIFPCLPASTPSSEEILRELIEEAE